MLTASDDYLDELGKLLRADIDELGLLVDIRVRLVLKVVAPQIDLLADLELRSDFGVADLGNCLDLAQKTVPHEDPSLVIGEHTGQGGLLAFLLEAQFPQVVA